MSQVPSFIPGIVSPTVHPVAAPQPMLITHVAGVEAVEAVDGVEAVEAVAAVGAGAGSGKLIGIHVP